MVARRDVIYAWRPTLFHSDTRLLPMKLHFCSPQVVASSLSSSSLTVVLWLSSCSCKVLVSCLGVRSVSAVTVAYDHAQDAAYAAETGGAWKGLNSTTGENPPGTDNGGAGFLTWN